MKPVALFVLPKCSLCEEAKAYFKSKKIRYNLVDVSKNKQALKDIQKHKCKQAPVVLIGNTWICGFDKKKINKELGIKG